MHNTLIPVRSSVALHVGRIHEIGENMRQKRLAMLSVIPLILIAAILVVSIGSFPATYEDAYSVQAISICDASKNMSLETAFAILSQDNSWQLSNVSYHGRPAILIENSSTPDLKLYLMKSLYMDINEPDFYISVEGSYDSVDESLFDHSEHDKLYSQYARTEVEKIYERLGLTISSDGVIIDDNYLMYPTEARESVLICLSLLTSYIVLVAAFKETITDIMETKKWRDGAALGSIFFGQSSIFLLIFLLIFPSIILIFWPIFLLTGLFLIAIGVLQLRCSRKSQEFGSA